MTLLLFYLFLSLFVSSLCSILEAVLLSTPQSYLMVKSNEEKPWAKHFIKLKLNIDETLSAILSLNTVAHTIGAAGVGAQAIAVFGEAYFGLVSAILTILILVFTEIIPKTIGARYWRSLTGFAAHTLRVMIIITYPLVILSAKITKFIIKGENKQTTSREEISALASIGAEAGIFREKEHKIIQNILRLKNIKVSSIMTPRIVVSVADENKTLEAFLKEKKHLHFSRIPLFADKNENITGYVLRQDILDELAENRSKITLKEIRRDIVIIPDTKPLFEVWETLLERKEHIALVVDEYGGMDGIVTMEDIIETILGLEIIDENDSVPDMQKYAKERWELKQRKYPVD